MAIWYSYCFYKVKMHKKTHTTTTPPPKIKLKHNTTTTKPQRKDPRPAPAEWKQISRPWNFSQKAKIVVPQLCSPSNQHHAKLLWAQGCREGARNSPPRYGVLPYVSCFASLHVLDPFLQQFFFLNSTFLQHTPKQHHCCRTGPSPHCRDQLWCSWSSILLMWKNWG